MLLVFSYVRYKFRINIFMFCYFDIVFKGLNVWRVLSDLNVDIFLLLVVFVIRLVKEICGKKRNLKQGYLNVLFFDLIKFEGKCLRSSYLL